MKYAIRAFTQFVTLILGLIAVTSSFAGSDDNGVLKGPPETIWTCEENGSVPHPYVPALVLQKDVFGRYSALVRIEHEAWDTNRVDFLRVHKTVALDTFIPREIYESRKRTEAARYEFKASIDITSDTEASGRLTVVDDATTSEVSIDCMKN